ncbi:MAG: hypothetical protein HY060_24145, partial [Proteobacteria bacterium]|nr:hypothetical protein [Pseudomonadota bacterium]
HVFAITPSIVMGFAFLWKEGLSFSGLRARTRMVEDGAPEVGAIGAQIAHVGGDVGAVAPEVDLIAPDVGLVAGDVALEIGLCDGRRGEGQADGRTEE